MIVNTKIDRLYRSEITCESKPVNILRLVEKYGELLWENGRHKSTCFAFLHEIHELAVRHQITRFDNDFLDLLVSEFRKRGNRNSTINRKLASLSKLLRKHHQNGQLDRLPQFEKLPEKNGRIRFLTKTEERSIIHALEEKNPDYGKLALFLVDTGARVGEALALKWADLRDRNVTFWETKSNHPRTVPLTSRTFDMLEVQRKNIPGGPFATIKYYNFRNAWNRAKTTCGLGDDVQVVPHILRHTCASRLAQSGVDIKRIQEFLGHKTLTMTLRYAHLCPKHLDVCASALDEFNLQDQGRSPPMVQLLKPRVHSYTFARH